VNLNSRTQMLDELADAQDLPYKGELDLQRSPWLDEALWIVRSVQIPRVESAEILDGAQNCGKSAYWWTEGWCEGAPLSRPTVVAT
jgi:hypothetical protein